MFVSDFDRVVCITVDTRFPAWPLTTRREVEAKGAECHLYLNGSARVAELGADLYRQLNGPVPEGFRGRPGAYHLARAFRAVVAEARRDGLETVLIVEDDLEFTPEYDEVLARIALPADWGLFYLGANHTWAETEAAGPHLLRLRGSLTTHCVAVHARAFAAVADLTPTGPIDDLLATRVHPAIPCYAAWPAVAVQRPGPSTISVGEHADYRAWFRSRGRNWPASDLAPTPPNPDRPTAADPWSRAVAPGGHGPDRARSDLDLAVAAELCPHGSGPCGCGGRPRFCSHPDRPAEVYRLRDCLPCVARTWWEAGVEAVG